MLCRVEWYRITEVSQDRKAIIFRFKSFDPEDEGTTIPRASATIYQFAARNILEDLNVLVSLMEQGT
jgi:hypothetical protein